MLIKASVEDIEKYGDLVYHLALDPKKSSYPTYADGIKTKSDFLSDAQGAATKEHDELLLFYIDGKVEGWISYYWIPKEKYLQLTGLHINRGTKHALSQLLELLEKKFVGFTAYFGFPSENQEATQALAERSFQCIERDWNHLLSLAEYSSVRCSELVEAITRDNYDLFRTVYHDNGAYGTPNASLRRSMPGRFSSTVGRVCRSAVSTSPMTMGAAKYSAASFSTGYSERKCFGSW